VTSRIHYTRPSITEPNWVASSAPIIYLGAKPVFVDSLPESRWLFETHKMNLPGW
jgi:dTDP-4-amino-4,6-dideoxygalactose transaminase